MECAFGTQVRAAVVRFQFSAHGARNPILGQTGCSIVLIGGTILHDLLRVGLWWYIDDDTYRGVERFP